LSTDLANAPKSIPAKKIIHKNKYSNYILNKYNKMINKL